MSNCTEPMIPVKESAVGWLKKNFPALCVKAGLCENVAGRLYTITTICECQRRTKAIVESEKNL
ncbi:hypothetical protein H0A71_06350 [Alcaligenaceae bacterium]|nr:hypothetical protein [Alcaligenaceae bacterium]